MVKKGTAMECYARRKEVRVIALRITRSGGLLASDALRSCYLAICDRISLQYVENNYSVLLGADEPSS